MSLDMTPSPEPHRNRSNHPRTPWAIEAYAMFKAWVPSQGEFMTEDFAAWSADVLPAPADPRAWGGITLAAAKAGVIRKVGMGIAKSGRTHGGWRAIWVAV